MCLNVPCWTQVTRDEGQIPSSAEEQVPVGRVSSASDRCRLGWWNQNLEARLWGAEPASTLTTLARLAAQSPGSAFALRNGL